MSTEPSVLAKHREIAGKNLLDINKLLKDLDLVFFLDGGTALGLARDGAFLESEQHKLTLSVMVGTIYRFADKGELLQILAEELCSIGFVLNGTGDWDMKVRKEDLVVEIFIQEKSYFEDNADDIDVVDFCGENILRLFKEKKIDRKVAEDNLMAMKKALDEMGVFFWLTCGTLLGAVRDDDFIGHDSDVDLGINIVDWTPEILKVAEKYGFKLYKEFGTKETGLEYSFFRNGMKLDLFFFTAEVGNSEQTYWMAVRGGKGMKEVKRYVFPLIYDFKTIEFKGHEFNVPENLEEYLEAQYGKDWRKPITTWDYFNSPHNLERQENDA